jgi:alkanesulfonate monooxygenase SsuD/methylene tetrahydromethanopterin reductase-like flavin-dependent oxidoreductase (luciferase family)
MDIGVFDHLDLYDVPLNVFYENRLRMAEIYDRAGFFAYHIAEHHGSPIGVAPSPSVFLAAVAQRTRRLRFGPMVYTLPMYHPLRLIEEICMLDQISGGRLEIGLGRGVSPIELSFFGVPAQDAQPSFDEALQVLVKGLTEPVLTFHGKYHHLDQVPMKLAPMQKPHPPFWYGVHRPESAAEAARQGFHTMYLDPPHEVRLATDRYREVWRQLHGERTPRIGLGRFIVVAETDAAARAIARRAYPIWHDSFVHLSRRYGRAMLHPRPSDFDGIVDIGQGIAGAPATVAAFLRDHIAESGANYLVAQFTFGDVSLEEATCSVDLFVREVAPKLDAALAVA